MLKRFYFSLKKLSWSHKIVIFMIFIIALAGMFKLIEATQFRAASLNIQSDSSLVNSLDEDLLDYTNSEFGYSLKYPASFSYQIWDTSNDPKRLHYISFFPVSYLGTHQPPEIGVVIYDNSEKIPLSDWVYRKTGNVLTETDAIFETTENMKEITLNNIPALEFTEESPIWGVSAPTVLLSKNNLVIRIFYTNAYSEADLSQTFKLILGSLKFTD